MIILVDQDGPLADLETAFAEQIYDYYDGKYYIPVHERRGFRADLQYEQLYGPEGLAAAHSITRKSGFYRTPSLVSGAKEALNEMAQEHQVFICTSPLLHNPTCASDKLWWIERYLGEEWLHRTIITKDKTVINGDFLIDDKDCIEIKPTHLPRWNQILWQTPYNEHAIHCFGADRMEVWSDWRRVIER